MANSYPILKMENISQVLLFSKYCLTLFFMFAWSFSWRKFSEFRMLYVCSSFYHIYSIRPWLLSKRKVRGPFVFPFSLLSSSSFFFFFFWWSISTSFKIHSKYTEEKHYVITFLGYIFNRKTWEQNFKHFLFAAI